MDFADVNNPPDKNINPPGLSSFIETSTSESVSGEQKEENTTPSRVILMDTSPKSVNIR